VEVEFVDSILYPQLALAPEWPASIEIAIAATAKRIPT
jgi:hypothetical protein